jgi:hypothetical protein
MLTRGVVSYDLPLVERYRRLPRIGAMLGRPLGNGGFRQIANGSETKNTEMIRISSRG